MSDAKLESTQIIDKLFLLSKTKNDRCEETFCIQAQ